MFERTFLSRRQNRVRGLARVNRIDRANSRTSIVPSWGVNIDHDLSIRRQMTIRVQLLLGLIDTPPRPPVQPYTTPPRLALYRVINERRGPTETRRCQHHSKMAAPWGQIVLLMEGPLGATQTPEETRPLPFLMSVHHRKWLELEM
uniref:Uncharacterized protein n=1 Tax=Knipowitschia caucasica TaxID=637954 RepID=A0AAV2M3T1_KNICA